jgi:hypothetical protein
VGVSPIVANHRHHAAAFLKNVSILHKLHVTLIPTVPRTPFSMSVACIPDLLSSLLLKMVESMQSVLHPQQALYDFLFELPPARRKQLTHHAIQYPT